jgi:hypothetical protein
MPYRGDACHRHHGDMTDTPESHTEAKTEIPRVVEPPRYRDDRYDRPNRLNQILTWVGIVAGVVFIVAVIFFSGFFIGRNSHGNFRGGWQPGMMGPSQTGPYGQMWPGMMGPGGMMGPSYGQWPSQQPPTTTASTTPRP